MNISGSEQGSANGKRPLSTVRNINAELQSQLTWLEKVAIFISDHVGTPGFFLLIVFWTASWVLWNSYAPAEYRFDRAMEFAVWIFVSNVIQICLLPLLMVAQNLQSRHDEMRAENEYEVNKKSAEEIEMILGHLHILNANVNRVMEQLDMPSEPDPTRDRVPDVAEEHFAKRQQELLDAMALKLAQTHERTVQTSLLSEEKPKNTPRLPK